MFDFDDLDEKIQDEVPLPLATRTAMSDSDFSKFSKRINEAARQQRYADIGDAIAEALWDEELVPVRLPKIIEMMCSLIQEMTSQKITDLGSAGAVVYIFFQLSLSTSLHEVCVYQPEAPERCDKVVLILGFGGSDVADLKAPAEFYRSKDFITIFTCRNGLPVGLSQKQDNSVAKALEEALVGGRKLLLHLCSQHGYMYCANILHKWTHQLAPFHNLPPAQECISALIFDCVAPEMKLPSDVETTKHSLAIAETNAKHDNDETEPDLEDKAFKNGVRFFRMVMLGCIGAMCKKWKLTSLEELAFSNKNIFKSMDIAAGYCLRPIPWVTEYMKDLAQVPSPWLTFQLFDLEFQPALPRLFLYSEKDMLITAEMVSAFVKHTQVYRPEAEVFEAKVKKSAHCELWKTEFEECGKAVERLLRILRIKYS